MTSEIDLANAPEERLIMRFLACWEEAAGERPMPALNNFSGLSLEPFKPFSVLIDLQDGYDNPVIRHVGRAIVTLMGKDCRGQSPHDVPRRSILSRVTDHFYEVLANRAPIGFEAAFEDQNGGEIPYRGILTPLGEDGETITFILAVINWLGSEQPPAATTADIPETGAPNEEPAPNDAPSIETATDYPSPVYQGDPETDLAGLKNAAQEAGRSRSALYDLLADIYGFYQGAGQTSRYRNLLDDHGIRPQARAPFTAALKLVLGVDYDKTRITEYAAAMTFAARNNLDHDRFRHALETTPGGLKSMVRAERAARRNGSRQGPAIPDANILADIATHVVIDDFSRGHHMNGESSDYVLLLARKSGQDQQNRLHILDALPAGPQDLKRFAAKQHKK